MASQDDGRGGGYFGGYGFGGGYFSGYGGNNTSQNPQRYSQQSQSQSQSQSHKSHGHNSHSHSHRQMQRQAQETRQQQSDAQKIQLFLDSILQPTLDVLDGYLAANDANKQSFNTATNSMVKSLGHSAQHHIKQRTPDLLDIAKKRVQKFHKERKDAYAPNSLESETLRVYVNFMLKSLDGDELPVLPSVRPREHNERVVSENMTAVMGATHDINNNMQHVQENESFYRREQQKEANAYRTRHNHKKKQKNHHNSNTSHRRMNSHENNNENVENEFQTQDFNNNDLELLSRHLDKDRTYHMTPEGIRRENRLAEKRQKDAQKALDFEAQNTPLEAHGGPNLVDNNGCDNDWEMEVAIQNSREFQ